MTKEDALRIACEYWPRGEVFGVYDVLPERCSAYGLPKDDCWYALGKEDKDVIALRNSQLLCIRRSDGQIIYTCPANDEG